MSRINKENKKSLEQQALLELFEEVKPDFLKGIVVPYRLYRYDKGEDRFYYRIDEQGNLIPYLSVTSFVGKSLPTSQFLIDWIAERGTELANQEKLVAAMYGTLLHIRASRILETGTLDFSKIRELVYEYLPLHLEHLAPTWIYKLKKDLAAFCQFLTEYKVEPIACELPVYSDEYGLGGSIDLPCRMQFNGGRVNAIVDIKSGRKGFHEGHELQLHTYKEIFNDSFPIEISHVFNWAPKDWRKSKSPTYSLKNQTNSIFEKSVIPRMLIARLEEWIKPPSTIYDIKGEVENVFNFNFEDHKVTDKTVTNALIEY